MKHYKHLFTFLVVIIFGTSSCKQKGYEVQKIDGEYPYETVSNDPTSSRIYHLKNGLTVLLSPNKAEPRIQTYIAVKAGSKTDPSTHTGLAHYLEHMLFKGTDKYGTLDFATEKVYLDKIDSLYEVYNHSSDEQFRKQTYQLIDSFSGVASKYSIANEYDKMMSSIGAEGTNAFTSVEQTVYVNDIPSNQMEKWLAIEGERFRNPVFRIFHTELEAVYEEKNRSIDNDYWQFYETAYATLFKKHPYGTQTTIGTIEHLKNPSLLEIRKYYNKNYVPGNMAIVMAGDFNPDETIKIIDKHFGRMPQAPIPSFQAPAEDEMNANIEKVIEGPMEEFIGILYRMPGKTQVRDNLLQQTLTSVLSRMLTLNLNQKQKVLSTDCSLDAMNDYSSLILSGSPRQGQSLDELKKLVLEQIELLKQGKFDDDLLTAILNNIKLNKLEENESNAGRAGALLDAFVSGNPWINKVKEVDDFKTITKQEVIDYANKYLKYHVCIKKVHSENVQRAKVEKPAITPVETNRDSTSAYVAQMMNVKPAKLSPVFVDYQKDLGQNEIKPGLPLFNVKNKDNELFSLYYVFDMGRYNDKKLPFAFDYTNYTGTDKYTAEEINKEFYKLACSFGISGGTEQSYVYLSGLQENFEPAVKLFEHLLNNAKPDQDALKKMIEGEMKSREDNKLDKQQIRQALTQYASYGKLNPFNDVMSENELKNMKAEELVNYLKDLKNFKHRIFYYGPLDGKDASELIGKLHTSPEKFKDYPAPKVFKRILTAETQVFFTNYNMVQAEITWQNNNSAYNPALVPTAQLFNQYFGGNMGSLVFQTIRESKALAYSTYANFSIPEKKEDPFTVVAYVGTQADKFNEAVAAMNELLTDMPRVDKLLATSKESIAQRIESERTLKSAIFFSYERAKRLGLQDDPNKMVYDALNKLSMDDIVSFQQQYIKNVKYNYCILGSKDKVKKTDMEKLGKTTEVSLTELFGY